MAIDKVNPQIALNFGISFSEFEEIQKNIGRLPEFTELCVIASVKNACKKSISQKLSTDKNDDRRLNCIRISDELSCVVTIESVQTPGNGEPFDTAANCISMAIRKIIASGASPLAGLNSFRFGLPEYDSTKKTAGEFIKGIGEIGNSTGFPLSGAKFCFENCFIDKAELNTMVTGLLEGNSNNGNSGPEAEVYIVSHESSNDYPEDIEIANIEDIEKIQNKDFRKSYTGYHEKLLIEATGEVWTSGLVSYLVPVGNQGLIFGLAELIQTIQKGIQLDFDKLPFSFESKSPISILLSGKSASLIVISKKDPQKRIEKIFSKWELNCTHVGQLIQEKKFILKSKNRKIVDIPTRLLSLSSAIPEYTRPKPETELSEPDNIQNQAISFAMPDNLKEIAWYLIKHPNIASKKWINEQYDSMVGVGNLSSNFVSDSILINLKGSDNALAMCMTGNLKQLRADPYIGAQIAVSAAARKISCTGAKPVAIIPGINFNYPHSDEDYSVFKAFLDGINKTAEVFNLPIVNQNINFNKQIENSPHINPACPGLTIGMIGILKNKKNQMTISFKNKGNIIFIIGPSREDVSASEYLVSFHGIEPENPPFFDVHMEYRLQTAVQELIEKKYICSAHNISRGGLFISLVESAMIYGYGFDIITDTDIRLDAFLFGEAQGRVLVSINPSREANFIDFMMKKEIPFLALGHVTKGEMRVDDISFGFIEDAKKAYENTLEKIIEN